MLNYALLDKLLELYIAKRELLDGLKSLTRFACMLKTVKITVNNCEISCYEIFRHMLKFDEIPLIGEEASILKPD